MANIFELCSNIPSSVVRIQQANVIKTRQQASYEKRMHALENETNIFETCKQKRTQKRVRNSFSSEQAGKIGMITHEVRTGTHEHIVCKSRAWAF